MMWKKKEIANKLFMKNSGDIQFIHYVGNWWKVVCAHSMHARTHPPFIVISIIQIN